MGTFTYGNIGTADRLDFTVIGPAVNQTARLESLTKEITLNVIEHMQKVVAVKKWTLGEQAPTGYQPDEIALLPEEAEERPEAVDRAEPEG